MKLAQKVDTTVLWKYGFIIVFENSGQRSVETALQKCPKTQSQSSLDYQLWWFNWEVLN